MPRTTYGDKFTVTVMKGEDKHTVFDVSSKIIDFCLVFEQDSTSTAPTRLYPRLAVLLFSHDVSSR